MKKIISYSILICIAFLLNISNALAKTSFVPGSTSEGFSSSDNNKYVLECENVEASIEILEVLKNNESKGDCKGAAGVFWDATDSKKISNLTEKLSNSDGKNRYILWAHSVTNGTTDKVKVMVNNSTTGKNCSGVIKVNNGSGSKMYVDDNSSVKFALEVKSNTTDKKEVFTTSVEFSVVKYMGNQGEPLGTYSISYSGNTQKIAENMTEYSKTNSEEAKQQASLEKEENQIETGNSGKNIPERTSASKINVSNSQKLECDDSLKAFINKIWKYVIIIAPILLLVMITVDFFKALFSSDQDLIKKAVNNTIKRTIAALILLALPLILSTLLGFFGIGFCK